MKKKIKTKVEIIIDTKKGEETIEEAKRELKEIEDEFAKMTDEEKEELGIYDFDIEIEEELL